MWEPLLSESRESLTMKLEVKYLLCCNIYYSDAMNLYLHILDRLAE